MISNESKDVGTAETTTAADVAIVPAAPSVADISMDEIERIIKNRVVKINVIVPNTFDCTVSEGGRLRVVYLIEEDYLHLWEEAIGGKYGSPARPEIAFHVFGMYEELYKDGNSHALSGSTCESTEIDFDTVKAKNISENAIEKEDFVGFDREMNQVTVMYEYSKNVYILCESIEAILIRWIRRMKALHAPATTEKLKSHYLPCVDIVRAYFKIGAFVYELLEPDNIRVFRRFLRTVLMPMVDSGDYEVEVEDESSVGSGSKGKRRRRKHMNKNKK